MPDSTPTWGRRRILAAIGLGLGAAVVGLPGTASAAAWSNPAVGTITSGYKPPSRPDHAGTDVANNQGTAIWAACAGTVVGVRTNSYPGDTRPGLLPGRTGNAVLIEHAGGYRTYYGHIYSAAVSKGQKVTAGQTIAAMGTTGNSTGPHLHFEVHLNGATTNPYTFLAAKGITLGSGGSGGGWPSVKQGAGGATVYVVQHLATAQGHSTPADGDFGTKTTNAIKAFQSAKKLVADGLVGPATWPKLVMDVSKGASGSKAKAAQVALNIHGAGLVVDGDFAATSDKAARAFQAANGLVVDGRIGSLSWPVLV